LGAKQKTAQAHVFAQAGVLAAQLRGVAPVETGLMLDLRTLLSFDVRPRRGSKKRSPRRIAGASRWGMPNRFRLRVEALEDRRLLTVDLGLLTDINAVPTSAGSNPGSFLDVDGVAFFVAEDLATGRELWKSGRAMGPRPEPFA
jgi:hypothetical protein